MDSSPIAFKGTIDIEHVVLDADDLAASIVDFLRTVRRSPAMQKIADHETFALLVLNLQTYLGSRARFVTTPAAAALTPTLNPNVVGETSAEPFPAQKATEIALLAQKALKRT
jgi:hypothetical protein